jgi:hypothetical protein
LTLIPLEKGYHKGLEILKPPEDNDWWDGEFTHFDFDSLFSELANSAPKTMADKSFQQSKWIINSKDRNEPVEWHEANLNFFSEFFISYLKEEGKNVEHFL